VRAAVSLRAPQRLGRLRPPRRLLLILQAELQLIDVKFLGTRAEAMAQQTLDQQAQLLVLGLQLRHHLPQHALQNIRIIREGREINLHAGTMSYVVASLPMTLS